MQTQTTITTETTNTTDGMVFLVTTFEQTTTAFCDLCDNQATGTIDELKRRGWTFGGGAEFCGDLRRKACLIIM